MPRAPRFLLLLALALAAPPAQAQIVGIELASDKAAKKHAKLLVDYRGKRILVGEPGEGILEQPGGFSYRPGAMNRLFVADPMRPGAEAYRIKRGERVPVSRKNRVSIHGKDIARLWLLMPTETLPGLAQEYRIRQAQLEELEAERDGFERTTREWATAHLRYVGGMQRLRVWLDSTAFPGAAAKLAKAIQRQKRLVKDEAVRLRARRALDSVGPAEVPDRLVDLAQKVSGGKHEFRAMASQHLRFYYVSEIPDEQVRRALELGEEIIEGFRVHFVDPYLDVDYKDLVPDHLFQEFLFVPKSAKYFEAYSHGFYGVDWTRNREERLKISGERVAGGSAVAFREYWRYDQNDLEGIVCHSLGHSLASLHYGGGSWLQQDWMMEGLGYYLSFEYLARNTVTCKAFNQGKTGYARRKIDPKKEGIKSGGVGRRDVYNEIALNMGRPIDQLALRKIFDMDDADLAKAWSFFDYMARKEGKAGQRWLRAAATHSRSRSTFITKWREAAADILGVGAADAFNTLERRWREYASGEQ